MHIYYDNGGYARRLEESVLSDEALETGLPVNIWLDTDRSYLKEFLGKMIRFQGDYEEEFNPRNLFLMTISRDAPSLFNHQFSRLTLPDRDIEAVREFVFENARLLEKLADEKITIRMFAQKMKRSWVFEGVRDPLHEMAKLRDMGKIPDEIHKRTVGRVPDAWWHDRSEPLKDMKKLALQDGISLGGETAQGDDIVIEFYYGFISSFHKYAKGDAKASGATGKKRWEFRALHIVSNVPDAEGQWMRDDFKDGDFDKMDDYEKKLLKSNLTGKQMVAKIVADFKLKKYKGSILQICDKLIN